MSAMILPAPPATRATVADLMRTKEKAELIKGKVVTYMAIGIRHSRTASDIFISLRNYERQTKSGYAFDDNIAFVVPELSSGRESFSPDASYFVGVLNLKDPGPVRAAPTFAVEVRSPEDYGPKAESDMAAKRDDYFEAGTLAVWDVDPKKEIVTLYQCAESPVVFHKGEVAHAEPVLPGWTINLDELFG